MSSRKHRDSQDVCARRVREIAQTGANRLCFECAQPGVTYTDVTVGCFVCTSCSGMLRGLNPPHRVKSISMTTFSPAEVDFLQNHGNEVGRRTWLCTLDPRDARADARDTPKLKEFLQDKYERKKWHFSRSKTRRDGEAVHTGPAPLAIGRPTRAPLWIWDRAAVVSPAESRSEFFSSRPTRSQSFRDHPVKDTLICGVQRQRPGIVSSETGMNNQLSSFPALPRPSASSTFKSSFTLGRTLSAGTGAPLRSFPKSLSLDFGGLAPAHSTIAPPPGSQDKYAALSQLCSDSSSATAGGGSCLCSCPAPPDGAGRYCSAPPAGSPDVPQLTSSGSCDTNPFCCGDGARLVLSPRNPFNSSSAGAPPRDTPPAPQENGCSDLGFFPADESVSRVTRPASVNPFTGHAYHSRGASLNPFI